MKLWLDKYTSDFIKNPTLMTLLEEFLSDNTNNLLSETIAELHTSTIDLKTNAAAISTSGDYHSSCDKCSHPSVKHQCVATTVTATVGEYKLFDKAPNQVARDLTAYDAVSINYFKYAYLIYKIIMLLGNIQLSINCTINSY